MGTLSAMAVWGPLYATIGGASRAVLQNGGNLGEVLSGSPAIFDESPPNLLYKGAPTCWLGVSVNIQFAVLGSINLQNCSFGSVEFRVLPQCISEPVRSEYLTPKSCWMSQ